MTKEKSLKTSAVVNVILLILMILSMCAFSLVFTLGGFIANKKSIAHECLEMDQKGLCIKETSYVVVNGKKYYSKD